ncbi:hypothetical protein [Thiocystis violascens]|uniref:Uncharacterized protein n=1 Tax=Thiocystis violascens (strain ATCC 17096 / DSM 198 / 6111) TaxID=765911 RepID=I3Y9B1_THIV6|nr:hypothetical protein [Thiocystis violascens]AFL73579.1 hypothetical protein Thivi_1591 [Thiocystis violascens DSM 198]
MGNDDTPRSIDEAVLRDLLANHPEPIRVYLDEVKKAKANGMPGEGLDTLLAWAVDPSSDESAVQAIGAYLDADLPVPPLLRQKEKEAMHSYSFFLMTQRVGVGYRGLTLGGALGGAFVCRIRYLINLATKPRRGKHPTSPRAARELCSYAAGNLEHIAPMPRELKDYIVTALRHVAAGGSADKALGIHRTPRLDALDQDRRDGELVRRVEGLRAQGKTKTAAIAEVARELLNTEDDTNLKRIYRDHEKRTKLTYPGNRAIARSSMAYRLREKLRQIIDSTG